MKTMARVEVVVGVSLCTEFNVFDEYQQTRERYREVKVKREKAT